ncbi:MAG: hypothetical protein K0M45_03220 [Candidatus Paracaedibacteraceae bacterium]|nr:hypothetical protein [Candidatus Paracaedibacteraceae bacterium]
MQLKSSVIMALVLMTPALSKDFGQTAQLFPIREENLLKVIMARLEKAQTSGLIEKHQKDLLKNTEKQLFKIPDGFTAHKAKSSSSRFYDPTITVASDLKTPDGKIIAKKGDAFNPLDLIDFGEPMLFIDGEDEKQCEWALQQEGQIIFVRGNSIRFEDKNRRPIYFDQHQKLIKKFNLQRYPSKISQAGKVLKIEEIGGIS